MPEAQLLAFLFTDVVGSTELLEQLGEDDFEILRRAHFRLLRDAVADVGGEEVKSVGDGVMAAFASSVDALRCATAMQRGVSRHNRRQPDRRLGVRIGVQVGEAVTEQGDYYGASVVVAQRLCGLAEAGQILCSELVRGLVGSRGGFEFRPLGPLVLKGIAEPVSACEVVWEEAGRLFPFPVGLAGVDSADFVGREAELGRVAERWARARQSGLELVLLAGEAGIGKTRLAAEFAGSAQQEGAAVLLGRCDEEMVLPYQPFVEALRHYATSCPPDELPDSIRPHLAELTQLVPDLASLLDDAASGRHQPEAAGEAGRYRLFDAMAAVLQEAAAVRPLVLILDDLHWADRATVLALRHLTRALGRAPVLFVLTYRDTELDTRHPLTEALAAFHREARPPLRLGLEGLPLTAIAALVARAAGGDVDGPAQELAAALHDATEGNPFFIREVLRHLDEVGVLSHLAEMWSTEPGVHFLGIPEGVKDVVAQRLGRLSDGANQLLHVAAIIGREFDVDVLSRLSGVDEHSVLVALEEGVAARVVVEVPELLDRFTFSHAIVRETLYSDLTASRRVRLHEKVGEYLEALPPGEVENRLPELAYHFMESARRGRADKAVDYSRRAGDLAVRQLAYDEAAQQYQRTLRALRFQDTVDERDRVEVLLALGDAQSWAGDRDSASKTFREALETARGLGLRVEQARAAFGLAWWVAARVDPELVAVLEDALDVLGDQQPSLRAQLLCRLAQELTMLGRREEAAALSAEAVQVARSAGDPIVLRYTLGQRRLLLADTPDPDTRFAMDDEMFELARESGDGRIAISGHGWRAYDLLVLGDVIGVEKEIAAIDGLVTELGLPDFAWPVLLRATLALIDGRFEEAERLHEQGLAMARRAQDQLTMMQFAIQRFALRWEQGRLAELEEGLHSQVDIALQQAGVRYTLAFLYSETGRLELARRELERLAGGPADIDQHPFAHDPHPARLALAAGVCSALGEEDLAAALYRMLLPWDGQHAVYAVGGAYYGAVAHHLGSLAATMGRTPDARRHFEEALEAHARIGARPWLARTEAALASLVEAASQPAVDYVDDVVAQPTEPALEPAGQFIFRRAGEYWTLAYEGEVVRLRDAKGLRHIAHLLRHRGQEVHALDLAGVGEGRVRSGDSGPVLDDRARQAYRRRVEDLRAELDEAEAFSDDERASRARAELQLLSDELSRAVGLGGRDRHTGSSAERARVSVTRAIRSAIAKIKVDAPALGHHLDVSVSTGTFCSYRSDPAHPVPWEL